MAQALRAGLRNGGLRRGGLRPGLGNGSLFAIAPLDLFFARNRTLDPRVTFTRASDGTYVGSDGLIKTATTNLITYSQTLNNAAWALSGTVATITAVTDIAAPDGSMTAWTLTSGAAGFAQIQNTFTGSAGATYTGSFWIRRRSGTAGTISIRVSENINTQLTGVTSSWQRFSFTATSTSTTIRLGINLSANTESIDIWGGQLEQSSTVGEYIPTTSTINSAPRFDHSPTTGESLGLLVEEQRTNLLTFSACDSNWTLSGATTVNSSLNLNALGQFSGYSLASVGQNWHNIYRTVSVTSGTIYAFSLYYRAGTSGRCRLTFRNNPGGTESIATGVAGSMSVVLQAAGTMTLLSETLMGDGVTYKLTGTITPNNTTTDYWFRIGPDSTVSGQTIIALGAQLEAGAFPTSYVPTLAATVTRSADVASITGTNFSSWYRQDEGTVFAETQLARQNTLVGAAICGIETGVTNAETIYMHYRGSSVTAFSVFDNSVLQADFSPYGSVVPANTLVRQAGAIKLNDMVGIGGGFGQTTDTVCTVPTPDRMLIGFSSAATNYLSGTIRRLTYWPQRLSNSTLQNITQP